MYLNIYYKNHLGQILNLVESPYRLQTAELFDYEWEPYTESGYITEFTKEVTKKTATLTVDAHSEEDFCTAVNTFYEATEKDVLEMMPGKLYIGSQYMECYLMSSKKTEWECGIEQIDLDVEFVTDSPNWVEEKEYSFAITEVISSNNKRYVGRYPYRYANGMNLANINVEHFTSVNFLLRIYGAVVAPVVSIDGHPYLVNVVVNDGERLEINSEKGTVYVIKTNGDKVNAFGNRSTDDEVFKKIEPGLNAITWSGKFAFDLVTYAERGEPKWKKYSGRN